MLFRSIQNIWVRQGAKGSALYSCEETIRLPAPAVEVTDTTGAGDAALAGWIYAWLRKKSMRDCIIYGHAMAEIILQTKGAHEDRLNRKMLEATVTRNHAMNEEPSKRLIPRPAEADSPLSRGRKRARKGSMG